MEGQVMRECEKCSGVDEVHYCGPYRVLATAVPCDPGILPRLGATILLCKECSQAGWKPDLIYKGRMYLNGPRMIEIDGWRH